MLDPQAASAATPLYIDVRSRGEFATGHLDGALNLPLDELQTGIQSIAPDPTRELVLYCASGARSAFGCAILQQMGYQMARNGGGVGALAMTTQRPIRRL